MKRITIILCAAALLVLAGCATKIAESQEQLPTAEYDSVFLSVKDIDEPQGMVRIMQEMEAKQAAEEAAAAAAEVDEGEWYDETYYEDYYEPSYSDGYSGDGFMQQGVRSGVDSDTETWYSSNQAYHYRTGEWSTDDEGYYRDSEGYYVVASNDYEQGSVVNTSKGEAKVYDDGTYSGNIDFYVGW